MDQPAWSEHWHRDDDSAADVAAERAAGLSGVEFVPPAAAKDLLDAVAAVGAVDLAALSEDERFGLLDALEHSERVLTAVLMSTLVAVDDRSEFDVRFGMTPGAYSEQRHGRDRLSWTRSLRIGRRLVHLPEIRRALLDGRISVERASVIANAVNARNAALLAEAQTALLELSARTPRFAEFAAQVRDLAAVADADGPEPEPERSKGKVSRTGDHVAVVMDLYGTDAIAAEQMLEAALDRLWKAELDDAAHNPELVPRSKAELRAAAFMELLRRGTAETATGTRRPAVELSLVIDADRVEDLDPTLAAVVAATAAGTFTGDLADGFLATTAQRPHPLDAPGDSCPACAGHHQLPDHVDLPGRFTGATVTVAAPDGSRRVLTQQQWQLLLCDSTISHILLDALGEPLAIRHLDRFADADMRRALTARDGGCIFPGCDAPPSWCDAHHVIEYQLGGHTVIVNLALLCRRHHGIVHRTDWHMTRNPHGSNSTGFFTITTPNGCTMATQHRPRPGPPTSRPPDPA